MAAVKKIEQSSTQTSADLAALAEETEMLLERWALEDERRLSLKPFK